ncbi:glycosyltransferase [Ideonella sp.]|uniref:glycosyltransferase n=1 Tax=Ideonella sp. TaxID=1929293 RepID=UPI0035AFFF75
MAVGPGAQRRGRILVLTPRWPWPADGGDRLRLLRLAQALAPNHDLCLLAVCQTSAEMAAPVPADAPFVAIHRVRLPRWRSWWNMAAALLRPGLPLQVAYYRSRHVRRAVQQLLPGQHLVACHLARMAPYGLGQGLPCWVELTDAVSLTMQRAAGVARARHPPRALLYALEARRMRAFERSVAARADLVSLVSPVDAGQLEAGGVVDRSALVVAPNGVTLPASSGLPAGARPATVALLGRMDSLANRDALWFFVREVWPGVRTAVPQARLHVIGRVADRDLGALRTLPGVVLHGVVPRLSDVLGEVRVGVCPVRFGAGMQNKLLDYLAHGCAAVTSPVGLEGLDAQPGRDLLVAADAHEWVRQTVRLLTDGAAATALAQAGRAVAERHGWGHALRPLTESVDRLLQPPTRQRRP